MRKSFIIIACCMFLALSLGGCATQSQMTAVKADIDEVRAGVDNLEDRVTELENDNVSVTMTGDNINIQLRGKAVASEGSGFKPEIIMDGQSLPYNSYAISEDGIIVLE